MRFLLDTHLLLWGLADPAKVPAQARALADAPENEAFASTVSIWEIAIKFVRNRGRPDDMPLSGSQALSMALGADIPVIDISSDHAAAVDDLPLFHADPSDRLLIAQARYEDMILLTVDKALAAYGECVMLV